MNVVLEGTTSHTATINWDKSVVPNSEEYMVNVISTDGSYTKLIPVTVNEATGSYIITGLPAGKEYEIGVDATVQGVRMEVGAIAQPAVTGRAMTL